MRADRARAVVALVVGLAALAQVGLGAPTVGPPTGSAGHSLSLGSSGTSVAATRVTGVDIASREDRARFSAADGAGSDVGKVGLAAAGGAGAAGDAGVRASAAAAPCACRSSVARTPPMASEASPWPTAQYRVARASGSVPAEKRPVAAQRAAASTSRPNDASATAGSSSSVAASNMVRYSAGEASAFSR